jgi:GTP-binding protein HflX
LQQAANRAGVFPVSALTGAGIDRLLAAISTVFGEEKAQERLHLPFAAGKARAWLHGEGVIEAEEMGDEGWQIDVLWTARQHKRYREL